MVYDSFQFFNELDILLLRMHILNDVVDKFVISESTVTFSGDAKPLYYEENKEMFQEFEHKIIHNVWMIRRWTATLLCGIIIRNARWQEG